MNLKKIGIDSVIIGIILLYLLSALAWYTLRPEVFIA